MLVNLSRMKIKLSIISMLAVNTPYSRNLASHHKLITLQQKILIIFLFIIPVLGFELPALGQVPQGFNYQAIAFDSEGKPLENKTLQVRLIIKLDSLSNEIIWGEIHDPVITSSSGLFALVLGKGKRQKESSAASFSGIDWTSGPRFLQTEIYYKDDWKLMGTSRLWSVPYALMAAEIAGPVNKLAVNGASGSGIDDALFEVKNKDGQTVFAVYSEGVRIFVDDGIEGKGGTKGGFAIGSFNKSKENEPQEYFIVSPDSIRAYIGTNQAKPGLKGGFAIGGFNSSKAPGEEYMRVTRDSTRVYISRDTTAKGTKGGFAIGSFSKSKGPEDNYLNVTPDNYFIGLGAGKSNTSGSYNSFMGYQTGFANNAGSYNSFIGHQTGNKNTAGIKNSFMGFQAGFENTSGNSNTFIGSSTGKNNKTGNFNTFLGASTGENFVSGTINTFIGNSAGMFFNNGNFNIFIGGGAGAGYLFPAGETGGQNNVIIGTLAGYSIHTGSSNVFLGNNAGLSNRVGNNNVFLGYRSGVSNNTGNDNIFIGSESGYTNSSGFSNIIMGYQAGYSNTGGYRNVFIGTLSGNKNNLGYDNVFMGNSSGFNNTSGFENTFIGLSSGYSNSSGNKNVYVGKNAGYNNQSGSQNVFIGEGAGAIGTSGSQNVLIGLSAGANNTSIGNVFVGWNAGLSNTTGNNNAFFGLGAGYSNTTAGYNTFIGFSAGFNTQSGYWNTYVGADAARYNPAGIGNVVMGMSASYATTSGSYNTIIGTNAAANLASGSNNIVIGAGAAGNLTGFSNRLFIDNSPGDYQSTLIYGEMDNNYLRFNGNVTINRLNYSGYGLIVGHVAGQSPTWDALYVYGNAYATGTFFSASDERWKKDIVEIPSVLDKLDELHPVYYNWRKEEYIDMDFSDKRQMGFIAQEVEKLFPEMVTKDHNGYLQLDYSRMTVILLQAVKEQQSLIESRDLEIQQLRAGLQSLIDEMEEIKTKINK